MQRYRPYICPFGRLLDETPRNARVLDVGCGGGLFLGLLASEGALRQGVGFDVSGKAIALAQGMATSSGAPISFERIDAGDDWPDGPFDVVSLIDVMHHVPTKARRSVVEQAARRLRPEGLFLYKDMCDTPRWRASANRLHDLVLARQWITYCPVEDVVRWATASGLMLEDAETINMLWYGHELRVFRKS